jgi:hypothetical protein
MKFELAAGLFVSPWFFRFTSAAGGSRDAWIWGAVIGVGSVAAILAYTEWAAWVSLV